MTDPRRDYFTDDGKLPPIPEPPHQPVERVCRVWRPESHHFELRDGYFYRVAVSQSGKPEPLRLLTVSLRVTGTYPPEGDSYEWGYLIEINGEPHRLPTKVAEDAPGLREWLIEREVAVDEAHVKLIAQMFGWLYATLDNPAYAA